MELQGNDFSGPIPPEFGNLRRLQVMSAANNAGLTGPLPAELTQLKALRRLLLGGTELCAPTNPQFLAWLRGVGATFVRRCVIAAGSDAYLTQAVQSREYPVPLIAGDSALLRVFVVSEEAADAGVAIPPARATFYRGDSEVYAVDLPGTGTTVPASVDESDLDLSLNAIIPGSVLQPGVAMVVEIDPEGTLDPDLGVTTRLPGQGETSLELVGVPTYELTLITFLWTEQPDSALLAKVNGITPDSPLLWATREFLPVHGVDVVHHDPIWLDEQPSAGNMIAIIWATFAAKEAEGGRGHWVGVWSGCCGVASYELQAAGVGLEPEGADHFWQNNNVLAHELGHLMTLPHAPCNVGDPDLNFPYPKGNIGSWGFDMRARELRAPDSPEVMSYCGERTKWISGFYHSQALGWRLRDDGSQARQVDQRAARVRSLMVWGGVQPDGELQLEPAFVLDAVPTHHIDPGPYRLTAHDDRGRELFSYSLGMGSLDHGGGAAFALMIPVQPEWETTLDRIKLVGPEGRTEVSREGATASILLTDPRTGQLRGFLRRRPDIALAASVGHYEVLRALLPEPGLVVHVSRGIPAPPDWRR
ncbi:MAG: M66 family metalloprotease [Gemmatimonadota bacterium]|nr:M66 family metalloprotease [Gemmatimonadota bacterium]